MSGQSKYRIIQHPASGGEVLRAVHHVTYDAHGNPDVMTGIPVEIIWGADEGDEAGLRLLDQVREAFALPVLHASEFVDEAPDE